MRVALTKRGETINPGRLEVPKDGNRMEIRLERATLIQGVLLDPDGAPIDGAQLQGGVNGGGSYFAFTDKTGAFSFNCKKGDVIDIVFHGTIAKHGTTKLVPMRAHAKRVKAGARNVRVECYSLAGDLSLPVRILDPDGEPVVGFSVRISPNVGSAMPLKTDEAGRVVFEGLSALERTIYINGPVTPEKMWVRPQNLMGTPGGREVVVRLLGTHRLEGRVIGCDGELVIGALVRLFDPDDSKRQLAFGRTDHRGIFIMYVPENVTRGRLVAERKYGKQVARGELALDAIDADAELEIQLEAPR